MECVWQHTHRDACAHTHAYIHTCLQTMALADCTSALARPDCISVCFCQLISELCICMYGVPFTNLHSLVKVVPLVYTPTLIPTHQPPPPRPSCSLSITVGVAVMVVSGVRLLIAVSSVCLGVLVTRDPNKLLARLLTPYQITSLLIETLN